MITKKRIDELKKQMREVPFGNSLYQIENFTAGKETPERRKRNLLLQIDKKLQALSECNFRRRKYEIDIAEINEKLQTETGFAKERLLIDKEEKEEQLDNELKLIEDAMIELTAMDNMVAMLPKINREQFEANEKKYWRARLLGDARREYTSTGTISVGTITSLEETGLVVGRNETGKIIYTENNEGSLEGKEKIFLEAVHNGR